MNVSFNVAGYYDIYDGKTGQIASVSKNKICPGFFTSFDDYRSLSIELMYQYGENIGLSGYWHALLLTNQLNLTITKNEDNFAYNDYVRFSEADNRYSMSVLGLKPLEVIEEETRYKIITRHCYRLPNKNLGNITGFAICKQKNDKTTPVLGDANKVSVSHVRDEFGIKGTFPHTEDTDSIIVYRVEYLVRKPLNVGVNFMVAPDNEQYYGPFSYTMAWLTPSEVKYIYSKNRVYEYGYGAGGEGYGYHQGYIASFKRPIVYAYPTADMTIKDTVEVQSYYISGDANVPTDAVTYQNPGPGAMQPHIHYSTIISNTDTSVLVRAFTSFELLEYNGLYSISDLEKDPVKYAKLSNNEPYKIRVRHGNLFVTDVIDVTTAGLHKVFYKLDISITISENEQYDE